MISLLSGIALPGRKKIRKPKLRLKVREGLEPRTFFFFYSNNSNMVINVYDYHCTICADIVGVLLNNI